MDEHFRQLTEYINQQLENGVAEEHIHEILIQHNWDAAMVDKAFMSIKSRSVAHASASVNTAQDLNQYHENHHTDAVTQTQSSDNQTRLYDTKQKYKVFQALVDTVKAMQNNLKTFTLTLLLSYVAILAVMFFSILILGLILHGAQLLLVSIFLFIIWNALATAFIIATTSVALRDGSENRKNTLSAVFAEGISRLGRIVVANTLMYLVIYLPFIFTVTVQIMTLWGREYSGSALLLLSVGMILSVIWICIAMVRFVLVPYVALFEPKVPIVKTLGRSKHLLAKGGQWFVIKGFLLYIFVIIILSLITGQDAMEVTDSDNIIVVILMIMITVIANGALVMLYINRKKIRG